MQSKDDHLTDYLARITGYLHAIRQSERGAIRKGAELLVDQIAADRLIHALGVGGHSYMGAEEFFCRAGHRGADLGERQHRRRRRAKPGAARAFHPACQISLRCGRKEKR